MHMQASGCAGVGGGVAADCGVANVGVGVVVFDGDRRERG